MVCVGPGQIPQRPVFSHEAHIVTLGFTRIYIIFLIFALKLRLQVLIIIA